MNEILRVENLSLRYGDFTALSSISFSLAAGRALALVGESGSGKSSCALAILGLYPRSARVDGAIYWQQQNLLSANDAQMGELRGSAIGCVFQDPLSALNPVHRIGQQIGESLLIKQPQLNKQQVHLRVQALLSEVGLSEERFISSFPHQLSGGQRQRALIASALINNPQLLILDEPTTALDKSVQAQIIALLLKLKRERQLAFLLISHDLNMVRQLADDVIVLKSARCVEMGASQRIFAQPQQAYTKKLLRVLPRLAAEVPEHGQIIVSARQLAVRYAHKRGIFQRVYGYLNALEPLDLSIAAGETLALLGNSGAGKSTLANALLNLQKHSGEVRFKQQIVSGKPESAMRPLRRNMQMIFQDPHMSLNPRMRVQELIGEALDLHYAQLDLAIKLERIKQALAQVELEPEATQRFVHQFSGGQKQRICLARALVLQPELLILDEPTSALDKSIEESILQLLSQLQQKLKLAYLLITHDLDVARALAHQVIILRDGKVVERGDIAKLGDGF